jgi:hypothetical protein
MLAMAGVPELHARPQVTKDFQVTRRTTANLQFDLDRLVGPRAKILPPIDN